MTKAGTSPGGLVLFALTARMRQLLHRVPSCSFFTSTWSPCYTSDASARVIYHVGQCFSVFFACSWHHIHIGDPTGHTSIGSGLCTTLLETCHLHDPSCPHDGIITTLFRPYYRTRPLVYSLISLRWCLRRNTLHPRAFDDRRLFNRSASSPVMEK